MTSEDNLPQSQIGQATTANQRGTHHFCCVDQLVADLQEVAGDFSG